MGLYFTLLYLHSHSQHSTSHSKSTYRASSLLLERVGLAANQTNLSTVLSPRVKNRCTESAVLPIGRSRQVYRVNK